MESMSYMLVCCCTHYHLKFSVILPVQGRESLPEWPAAGCTAVGCTEGRTEGRGMRPGGLQRLMQLAAFEELKYHGRSVAPPLSLGEYKIINTTENLRSQHWIFNPFKTKNAKQFVTPSVDIYRQTSLHTHDNQHIYLWSWGIFPGWL